MNAELLNLFIGVRGETVWKIAGGLLIACVSPLERARRDISALFWLLAALRIEACSDFPDSLWKVNSRKFRCKMLHKPPASGATLQSNVSFMPGWGYYMLWCCIRLRLSE
jgi:hypothetical protein